MSRTSTFYSLGMLPLFMGLSHLAPAIGAIRVVTGSYQFPVKLLGLICTISAAVDALDSYKDIAKTKRPSSYAWKIWICGLWTIVLACTVLVGFETAVDIYRVLPLGLFWGIPCIPQPCKSNGVKFVTPKALLSISKSLVVAICMAMVTANSSMAHFCRYDDAKCDRGDLKWRSFALAVLYEFFRETSCDMRDIAEDEAHGMQTLPIQLGKKGTMVFMTLTGCVVDVILTDGLILTTSGIVLRPKMAFEAITRVGVTMMVYWQILKFPRENNWAWGFMSLFGLVPVLFAQAAIRESIR